MTDASKRTTAGADAEGAYGRWIWDNFRQCWELSIPVRIYPLDDGSFVTSYADCWNTPDDVPKTFADAETAALKG